MLRRSFGSLERNVSSGITRYWSSSIGHRTQLNTDFRLRQEAVADKVASWLHDSQRTEEKRRKQELQMNLKQQDYSDRIDSRLRPYLTRLSACGTFGTANDIYQEIKTLRIPLHVVLFTKMIKLINKDVEMCEFLLNEMDKASVRANSVTYGTALAVARRAGNLSHGLKIWARMVEAGVQPNLVAYSTIISTCGKATNCEKLSSSRVALAETYFNQMKDNMLDPDNVCYGALLGVYAKAGEWKRSFHIIDEMRSKGRDVGEVGFTALISALVKAGENERAVECFKSAESSSLVNDVTYSVVIGAFLKLRQHSEVKRIWEIMRTQKSDRRVALCAFIQSLAMCGEVEQLHHVVSSEQMDETAWKCLIDVLWKRRNVDEALHFYKMAYKLNWLPIWKKDNVLDLHGYNSGVAGCAIRYVLSEKLKTGSLSALQILVGRRSHSDSSSKTELGMSVRELLTGMGVKFTAPEFSRGGMLFISSNEMHRLSEERHIDIPV